MHFPTPFSGTVSSQNFRESPNSLSASQTSQCSPNPQESVAFLSYGSQPELQQSGSIYNYYVPEEKTGFSTQFRSFYNTWLVPLLKTTYTRRLLLYSFLNLSYTFLEIFVGYWCGSLSLMGDGFHMFLDAAVMFANLFTIVVSEWPPTSTFPFGFNRAETIASFVNALLLLFVSLTIAVEAVERLITPSSIQTYSVIIVAIIGLVVNIYGLVVFELEDVHLHHHHGSKHPCDIEKNDSDSPNNDNGHIDPPATTRKMLFSGMFLHVMADTLGSISVIFSALIVQLTNWQWIDPVCSLFLSVLILVSSWPLLCQSLLVLMQTTPQSLKNQIESIRKEIGSIHGVLSISSLYIWQLKDNHHIGMVYVSRDPSADPDRKIKYSIRNIFEKYHIKLSTIEIID